MLIRYLPFLDLRGYRRAMLGLDLSAAIALVFVTVPQAVAFSLIAGLPPSMGLYAAAVPAIVGSLLRSSRHVITGPTNALSLLVGSAVAGGVARTGASPPEVALTLALLVGLLQLGAGVLRLGALVDYISHPVLRGYITGAGVLIAVAQLPNATGLRSQGGNLPTMLGAWVAQIDHADVLAMTLGLGTSGAILLLRRIDRRIPAAILAMVGGILVSALFDLPARGLRIVGAIAPTPNGLPPFDLPPLALAPMLLPGAIACAVLSLVEASSVGRSIASRTRQRLDMNVEFTGQGLANLTSAVCGGFPVGGSLSRSALNEVAGAQSRLSGALSGLLVVLVLFVLGPLVDRTPVASLAGVLFVVAWDLIDFDAIRQSARGTRTDRIGFTATLIGTWLLPLDRAIYLGVGISIVLFLRRARLLTVRELVISDKGRFREVDPQLGEPGRSCAAIRIMNLTGPLFFAVAGELEAVTDRLLQDPDLRVLILRLRQASDLDVTAANALEAIGARLTAEGRALLLLGLRPPELALLEQTGIAERMGRDHLFAVESEWFSAMSSALRWALSSTGPHGCGARCPLRDYLTARTDDTV